MPKTIRPRKDGQTMLATAPAAPVNMPDLMTVKTVGRTLTVSKAHVASPATVAPASDPYAIFANSLTANFPGQSNGVSRGTAVVENIKSLAADPAHAPYQLAYATVATMALDGKIAGYAGAVVHFRLAAELTGKLPQDLTPFAVMQQLEADGFVRMGHGKKGTTLWFVTDLFDKPQPKAGKAGATSNIGSLVAMMIGGAK